jgi:hypothetical protein
MFRPLNSTRRIAWRVHSVVHWPGGNIGNYTIASDLDLNVINEQMENETVYTRGAFDKESLVEDPE